MSAFSHRAKLDVFKLLRTRQGLDGMKNALLSNLRHERVCVNASLTPLYLLREGLIPDQTSNPFHLLQCCLLSCMRRLRDRRRRQDLAAGEVVAAATGADDDDEGEEADEETLVAIAALLSTDDDDVAADVAAGRVALPPLLAAFGPTQLEPV